MLLRSWRGLRPWHGGDVRRALRGRLWNEDDIAWMDQIGIFDLGVVRLDFGQRAMGALCDARKRIAVLDLISTLIAVLLGRQAVDPCTFCLSLLHGGVETMGRRGGLCAMSAVRRRFLRCRLLGNENDLTRMNEPRISDLRIVRFDLRKRLVRPLRDAGKRVASLDLVGFLTALLGGRAPVDPRAFRLSAVHRALEALRRVSAMRTRGVMV